MRRILLVEDDSSLGESLAERLSIEFDMTWVQTLADANQVIREAAVDKKNFELAILDVGLPDGNGFTLARNIRQKYDFPLIFLTAQGDAESRLLGYEIGAEEFIPKPFHLKELLLRVHHVLREHPSAAQFDLGSFELKVNELLLIKRDTGNKILLSTSEAKFLELLVKRTPQVLHRDELINEIWGEDRDLSHRTIDNMVLRLRSALEEEGPRIKTVRGVGYQWI